MLLREKSLSTFPTVSLQQPKELVFGPGSRKQALAFLRTKGVQRLLLMASNSCLLAQPEFLDSLKAICPRLIVDTALTSEPSVNDLETLLARHREEQVDAVLAMGGGSVIDVAKLFCVLSAGSAPLTSGVRQLYGRDLVPRRDIPLLALPTTAGAGSEVSPIAILYDETSALKQAVISPYLIPDMTCVDPELTLGLPPDITAATGMDALCHCIEAYTNQHAHPVIDLIALEGIRLIGSQLAQAVKNGADLEARTAVALGSLYGGLCLGPVNTAGVHALSYPLGSALRLPHGISNAVLLPAVFRYNLEATPERHADVGRALGLSGRAPAPDLARQTADRLDALLTECAIPSGLAALGLTRDQIPSLAAASMKVERLLRNNPRPLQQKDAEQIYHTAY